MSVKNIDTNKRPWEKALMLGFSKLTDTEVMAILLKNGSKTKSVIELADELIDASGGIKNIGTSTLGVAKRIKGIGKTKAITIMAAIELSRRIDGSQEIAKRHVHIEKTIELVKHIYDGRGQEIVSVVGIGARNKIVLIREVFKGGIDSSVLEPREIFSLLLGANARKFILFHNHPSGDPTPSIKDEITTKQIKLLGQSLGVILEDHIIIGDQIYYSMMKKEKILV